MEEKDILIITTTLILGLIHALKKKFWVYSLITLLGTFMHEISHLLMSFIFNGRPIDFNIFPKKRVEGRDVYYELGYVINTNIRWYNGLIVGLSPLLLVPFAYHLYTLDINFIWKIILIPIILEASLPSRTDIKLAIESSYGLLIFFGLLLYLYYEENSVVVNLWRKINEIYFGY